MLEHLVLLAVVLLALVSYAMLVAAFCVGLRLGRRRSR